MQYVKRNASSNLMEALRIGSLGDGSKFFTLQELGRLTGVCKKASCVIKITDSRVLIEMRDFPHLAPQTSRVEPLVLLKGLIQQSPKDSVLRIVRRPDSKAQEYPEQTLTLVLHIFGAIGQLDVGLSVQAAADKHVFDVKGDDYTLQTLKQAPINQELTAGRDRIDEVQYSLWATSISTGMTSLIASSEGSKVLFKFNDDHEVFFFQVLGIDSNKNTLPVVSSWWRSLKADCVLQGLKIQKRYVVIPEPWKEDSAFRVIPDKSLRREKAHAKMSITKMEQFLHYISMDNPFFVDKKFEDITQFQHDDKHSRLTLWSSSEGAQHLQKAERLLGIKFTPAQFTTLSRSAYAPWQSIPFLSNVKSLLGHLQNQDLFLLLRSREFVSRVRFDIFTANVTEILRLARAGGYTEEVCHKLQGIPKRRLTHEMEKKYAQNPDYFHRTLEDSAAGDFFMSWIYVVAEILHNSPVLACLDREEGITWTALVDWMEQLLELFSTEELRKLFHEKDCVLYFFSVHEQCEHYLRQVLESNNEVEGGQGLFGDGESVATKGLTPARTLALIYHAPFSKVEKVICACKPWIVTRLIKKWEECNWASMFWTIALEGFNKRYGSTFFEWCDFVFNRGPFPTTAADALLREENLPGAQKLLTLDFGELLASVKGVSFSKKVLQVPTLLLA